MRSFHRMPARGVDCCHGTVTILRHRVRDLKSKTQKVTEVLITNVTCSKCRGALWIFPLVAPGHQREAAPSGDGPSEAAFGRRAMAQGTGSGWRAKLSTAATSGRPWPAHGPRLPALPPLMTSAGSCNRRNNKIGGNASNVVNPPAT